MDCIRIEHTSHLWSLWDHKCVSWRHSINAGKCIQKTRELIKMYGDSNVTEKKGGSSWWDSMGQLKLSIQLQKIRASSFCTMGEVVIPLIKTEQGYLLHNPTNWGALHHVRESTGVMYSQPDFCACFLSPWEEAGRNALLCIQMLLHASTVSSHLH